MENVQCNKKYVIYKQAQRQNDLIWNKCATMHNVKVPTKIPSDRGLGGWHQNFTGVPYNYTPNPRGCLTHVKK